MRWFPTGRGPRIRLALMAAVFLGLAGWFYGRPGLGWLRYQPQEGDVVFQSLPRLSDLVIAIEGGTHSPFSHCGIVEKIDGKWMVLEALGEVHRTPLFWWIWRGRSFDFAVYRLRPAYRQHIPAMLRGAETFMGFPYDFHYSMNDEAIYCSELVYKGYLKASGQPLGRLVPLGSLDWQPYKATIMKYEGCTEDSIPVKRLMITPRDLAQAPELEPVFSWGY